MIFFRFILFGLVIYLIVRMIIGVGEVKKETSKTKDSIKTNSTNGKKISKGIGEYIDYEDVDK
jgi:hypothetical protein